MIPLFTPQSIDLGGHAVNMVVLLIPYNVPHKRFQPLTWRLSSGQILSPTPRRFPSPTAPHRPPLVFGIYTRTINAQVIAFGRLASMGLEAPVAK